MTPIDVSSWDVSRSIDSRLHLSPFSRLLERLLCAEPFLFYLSEGVFMADGPEYWKDQYDRLKGEFDVLEARLKRTQQDYQDLKSKTGEDVAPQPVTSPTEFEETLKRLVVRVAMILQAERCCFLLLERDTGELV